MKKLICFTFICFSVNLFGQKNIEKNNFNREITKVKGDLNKDNINDFILVTQDTINEISPYKLEVFFGQPNGKYKLVVSTNQAIEPEFPDGKNVGYNSDSKSNFSEIIIKNGILSINIELIRGHFEHKFRFQNNNFELIGYTFGFSNGRGQCYTTDFNLSTGIRIEKNGQDRKSTRLNSSHQCLSRMPSSA